MQGLVLPDGPVVGGVLTMLPGGDLLPALEYGYDGWECPRCGNGLGSCSGPDAVVNGQACGCGVQVVRVTLVAALAPPSHDPFAPTPCAGWRPDPRPDW